MTTTKPLEYITINGIQYKTTPIKSLEHIQVVNEFNDYLDSLDAEIFNNSLERYGEIMDLKYFNDLFQVEYLNEEGVSKLKQCITIFKNAVKEVVQERINELATKYLVEGDIKPSNLLKQSMDAVLECITYHELNGLTDTQEFIDWEDELNLLSVKEHPEFKHPYWNFNKNNGIQLEVEH